MNIREENHCRSKLRRYRCARQLRTETKGRGFHSTSDEIGRVTIHIESSARNKNRSRSPLMRFCSDRVRFRRKLSDCPQFHKCDRLCAIASAVLDGIDCCLLCALFHIKEYEEKGDRVGLCCNLLFSRLGGLFVLSSDSWV